VNAVSIANKAPSDSVCKWWDIIGAPKSTIRIVKIVVETKVNASA
jgi:hypothetical protein